MPLLPAMSLKSISFFPERQFSIVSQKVTLLDYSEFMPNETSKSTYQESATDETPKLWKCGDPYQFLIPKSDGDQYEKLLAPLLKRDKMQCDAWKDEVQNLLIFAGLFSAIVTAFVIDSYQTLQPNPNDAVINLLTRIADRLDGSLEANATTFVPVANLSPPSFSPTPRSIRINIFWFISLVLSLTTVLIAIVSLQWLREHQNYDVTITPQTQFALFNLRAHGFKRWYVPQLFSALPVLLQAALVLFLIGIGELLLVIGNVVAIPVIVVIGLPILFLFATTTFPTYQLFALYLPLRVQVNERIPAPCPYKSPQSHIFLRLATFSERLFRVYAWMFHPFYLVAVTLPRQFFRLPSSLTSVHDFRQDQKDRLDYLYDWWQARDLWSSKGVDWGTYDLRWLAIRTRYSRFLYDLTFWRDVRRPSKSDNKPIYDVTQGFRRIIREKPNIDQFHSLYHSVEELSSKTIHDWKRWSGGRIHSNPLRENHYLQVLLRSLNTPSFRNISFLLLLPPEDISFDTMHETNVHAFLAAMAVDYSFYRRLPILKHHLHELHIRIMAAFLAEKPERILFNDIERRQWSHYGPFGYQSPGQHPDDRPNRRFPLPDAISHQWAMILVLFFQAIAAQNREFDNNWDMKYSLKAIMQIAVENKLDTAFEPSLSFIANTLRSYLDNPVDESPDFLFYVASFYVDALEREKRKTVPGLEALIPVMRRYFRFIDTDIINLDVHGNIEIRPIHFWKNWLPDIFHWQQVYTPTTVSATQSLSSVQNGISSGPATATQEESDVEDPPSSLQLAEPSSAVSESNSNCGPSVDATPPSFLLLPPSPSPPSPSSAPHEVVETMSVAHTPAHPQDGSAA